MDVDRFWSKIRKQSLDECWPWTGFLDGQGRGRFRPGGRNVPKIFAHRLAYQLAYQRQIPDGMIIRHSCDNPTCCNPAHLSVGTHKDNSRDMVERGRSTRNNTYGAKLTPADVEWVRSSNLSQVAMARALGVSRSTICEIVNGKIWKMVGVSGVAPLTSCVSSKRSPAELNALGVIPAPDAVSDNPTETGA